MMNNRTVGSKIRSYYADRLAEFGTTPAGVDWNSIEAQVTRFDQITKLLPQRHFSVLDFGCGYGALFDFLRTKCSDFTYVGFDLAPEMVSAAKSSHKGEGSARFVDRVEDIPTADFVVASGIFSVKTDVPDDEWRSHIHDTIRLMNVYARKGLAFNLLTSFSDIDRRRPHLHYADPHEYFDLARTYSRWVSILHDYGLYEFTILIRKE